MSYTSAAEAYSCAAARPHPVPGYDTPNGWSSFNQIYSEIADATPVGPTGFRTSELIDQCPSIAHLAVRTQGEILRVVIRDMLALPVDCDGLIRSPGCRFVWRFADREVSS